MELIGGKTLQEIQDLPLSQMYEHMEKHFHPKWGKSTENSKNEAVQYHVQVRLETVEFRTFHVEARDEEEAGELAEVRIREDFEFNDYEITELEETA